MPEIAMPLDTKKAANTEAKSGMITIACKHPSGLVLELDDSREEAPTPGANKVKFYFGTGRTVTLNGSNSSHPDSPQVAVGRVSAGFGLTDIPESFWDKWVEQHPDFPMLKNGTLFALRTQDAIMSETANRRAVKNGLEPRDPDNPGPGLARENGKAL